MWAHLDVVAQLENKIQVRIDACIHQYVLDFMFFNCANRTLNICDEIDGEPASQPASQLQPASQ
jgi:hypothetical protein